MGFIAAGMAWVDVCELDPAGIFAVNRDARVAVAEAARASGARTVYYWTEYAFDGRSGPFREDSPGNPASVYGKNKLPGEQAPLAAHAQRTLPGRRREIPGMGDRPVYAVDGSYQPESAHYPRGQPREGGTDNPKGHAPC